MKCPYCGKKAKIDDVVKRNLESYGGSARARTKCCGKIVRVYPIIYFTCNLEYDQQNKDDWGN